MWWKLDWYFIDHFSSFWGAWCFWVERNQFLLDLFRLLMLLLHEIHQLFFCLFENLIIFIKLGLEFGLKSIFWRWIFRSESKHFIFSVFWQELVWFHLFFYLELYQLLFWLFKNLIIWRNLGLEFTLKVIYRRWIFRGESKYSIFNVLSSELLWFNFLFYVEL